MSIEKQFLPQDAASLTVGGTAPAGGAKRLLDLLVGGVALLASLPIWLLAALAIKLDSPGPVLFRQQRIGFNGRPFQIVKFRTLSVLEDGESVIQVTRDDPRVTRIGHLLRRSSLDELPQLLNVLAGDMSLVGPRPHAVLHDDYYGARIANYAHRRRVRPGITGWAQVKGVRGATPTLADMQERADLDAWYVDHQSLKLDLLILLLTPMEILLPARE